MKRVVKNVILTATMITVIMSGCNKELEADTVGTGSGQIEFQGKTYQLDKSDMYIMLNKDYPPLYQLNIWGEGGRFIIVVKGTSSDNLSSGTYIGEDIETAQFDCNDGAKGFSVGKEEVYEAKMELSKHGKTYDMTFTAKTFLKIDNQNGSFSYSTDTDTMVGYKVTWYGTLPIVVVRKF